MASSLRLMALVISTGSKRWRRQQDEWCSLLQLHLCTYIFQTDIAWSHLMEVAGCQYSCTQALYLGGLKHVVPHMSAGTHNILRWGKWQDIHCTWISSSSCHGHKVWDVPLSFTLVTFLMSFFPMAWRNPNIWRHTGFPWWVSVVHVFLY